jgi:hypothetical protein
MWLFALEKDMVKKPETYQQSKQPQSPEADKYNLKIDDERGRQLDFSFWDLVIRENAFPFIDYLRQQAK